MCSGYSCLPFADNVAANLVLVQSDSAGYGIRDVAVRVIALPSAVALERQLIGHPWYTDVADRVPGVLFQHLNQPLANLWAYWAERFAGSCVAQRASTDGAYRV